MERPIVVVGSDDTYPAAHAACEFLREKGFQVVPIGALVTGKVESWVEVAFLTVVPEAVSRVALVRPKAS